MSMRFFSIPYFLDAVKEQTSYKKRIRKTITLSIPSLLSEPFRVTAPYDSSSKYASIYFMAPPTAAASMP